MGQRWLSATQVMSAQNIFAGSTGYSVSVNQLNQVGAYAALQIAMSPTTGLTINHQCSIDGITFWTPTNATAVTAGNILATGVTTATATYVTFTPVVAPYVRYSVVPIASSTVTLSVVLQGESNR
jgi:hypothetical protein